MKLVRYGAIGHEKPGLIDKSGQLRDLSSHVKDLNGDAYSPASLKKLAALDPDSLPTVSGKPRLGPPVTGISKFVAIGLNYVDHAKETGNPIPPEPIFFLKANTSLSGPNDAVEKPRGSTKLDWEVEIAAIIGTRAKYISEADALNHVAGYCICNDVSERNFQIERGGTWTKGKSHDTFGPLGPWLVTKDEIKNPQNLDMARRQRQETPARQHLDHDLRLPAHRLGLFAVFRHGAGRCHHHRHATGRRARHQARTKIPQGRRRSHARRRRPGRATAEDREV
jgi:2-keto-4-pentenoate hydratase/2-oxohepta-3-ene-1,7-dioic acid hydratase in catechol pathway